MTENIETSLVSPSNRSKGKEQDRETEDCISGEREKRKRKTEERNVSSAPSCLVHPTVLLCGRYVHVHSYNCAQYGIHQRVGISSF